MHNASYPSAKNTLNNHTLQYYVVYALMLVNSHFYGINRAYGKPWEHTGIRRKGVPWGPFPIMTNLDVHNSGCNQASKIVLV